MGAIEVKYAVHSIHHRLLPIRVDIRLILKQFGPNYILLLYPGIILRRVSNSVGNSMLDRAVLVPLLSLELIVVARGLQIYHRLRHSMIPRIC